MLRKIYVRHQDKLINPLPDNENHYASAYGFQQLGVEVSSFGEYLKVEDLSDLSDEVGVHGHVKDVWDALKVMHLPLPPPLDYPEELQYLLGRKTWRSTLAEVVPGTFVKPVRHKAFTGRVWTGTIVDRLATLEVELDEPVWCSEVVDFVSEYRGFVLEDRLLDVRRYKGDWSKAPDRKTLEAAVMAYGSAPAAYGIDVGVTRDGRTLLVEVNEGFALGAYGLDPVYYARMIAARWEQLTAT